MKYFFILGNNPALSVAEISAVFSNAKNLELLNESILILETEKFDAKEKIKQLGGTIKIGIITSETSQKKLQEEINKLTDKKKKETKFNFGFSFYGAGKTNPKVIGMETKKHLREQGISCRWVTSKEKSLSSVVVEQNKLTKTGIEINIIKKDNHFLIGETLAVQPFKELSYRDYSRPARDDKSGMLPPKLAQIMINLTGLPPYEGEIKGGHVLLDPFCGSGTIITEAMLMGYQNLIGTDLTERSIQDTQTNIDWIQDKFKIKNLKLKIFQLDATKLSSEIESESIDAIVTEPYLGPQRGKIELKKIIKELEDLYSKTINEFEKILKKDGTVVMLFPVFYNKYFINPKLGNFKIQNPIPEKLKRNKNIHLTNRNTIIYGREGQKVWREIVILKK